MERRTLLAMLKGGIAETVPKDVTRDAMIALPPRPEYQTVDDFNVELVLSARRPLELANEPTSAAAVSSSDDTESVGMTIPEEDEPQPVTPTDWKFLSNNYPVFVTSPSAPKTYAGLHLIILVHGFQGNSMDMRVIRNQLSLVFPEGIYLLSSSNEEHTEGEISALGKRLAEVRLDHGTSNNFCAGASGVRCGPLSRRFRWSRFLRLAFPRRPYRYSACGRLSNLVPSTVRSAPPPRVSLEIPPISHAQFSTYGLLVCKEQTRRCRFLGPEEMEEVELITTAFDGVCT